MTATLATTGPATVTETVTEWLPLWAVAAMQTKVDAANRKAARAGLGTPFALTVVSQRTKARTVAGVKVAETEAEVLVTGEAVSLPGWRYAAKVDWSLSEPVLNVSPWYTGGPLPRPTTKHCDHCGTARSRKETHLVTGPDGAVQQVGSSCLTAYTGITPGWVSLFTDLAETDDDGWYGGRVDPSYGVLAVLTTTVALVDALGYTSKTKADSANPSTVDRFAIAWHGARTPWEHEVAASTRTAMQARSRSDADIAAEALAVQQWAAAQRNASSDYLRNLAVILGDTTQQIGPRHLGYATSAVSAYRREQAQRAQRAAAAASRTPLVGGRQTVTGTIESVRVESGYYGEQVKARIATDTGSALWGTLPAAIRSAVAGQRVRFTATVEVSDRDPGFGFYSRPTKAEIIG